MIDASPLGPFELDILCLDCLDMDPLIKSVDDFLTSSSLRAARLIQQNLAGPSTTAESLTQKQPCTCLQLLMAIFPQRSTKQELSIEYFQSLARRLKLIWFFLLFHWASLMSRVRSISGSSPISSMKMSFSRICSRWGLLEMRSRMSWRAKQKTETTDWATAVYSICILLMSRPPMPARWYMPTGLWQTVFPSLLYSSTTSPRASRYRYFCFSQDLTRDSSFCSTWSTLLARSFFRSDSGSWLKKSHCFSTSTSFMADLLSESSSRAVMALSSVVFRSLQKGPSICPNWWEMWMISFWQVRMDCAAFVV